MKAGWGLVLALVLLAFGAGFCGGRLHGAPLPCQETPADVMAAYYKAQGWDDRNPGFVRYCGGETQRFAAMLGLGAYVPTMLAQWHVESAFRSVHGDDGRSFGVTQIILGREAHWRAFWLKRGLNLGSVYDPSTQIAFGVAEFYECLGMAKGNTFQAVRRYNGSGWRARAYARRVLAVRKAVFGIPEHRGVRQ